jgi:hypothetical protein
MRQPAFTLLSVLTALLILVVPLEALPKHAKRLTLQDDYDFIISGGIKNALSPF